jgi:hypothetical protein
MKFQSQPNMWSCSVTSAAMVMDEPVHDLIARIGHDGGEVVFPHLSEPMCRAGFASQEIIDAALAAGWSMTPIEAKPQCTPNGPDVRDVFPESKIKERMDDYFKRYSGLVAGERIDGRYWHNVAWDCEKQLWLDPSGPILPRERSPIKVAEFWVFMKNEHHLGKTFLDTIIKRPKKSFPELEPVKVEPFDFNEPVVDQGPRRFA